MITDGFAISAADNIFLRQAIREGALPFAGAVNTPNVRTAALVEAVRLLAAERSRLSEVRGYSVGEFQNNMREAIISRP